MQAPIRAVFSVQLIQTHCYWHRKGVHADNQTWKRNSILEILSQLNCVELLLPFDLMLKQKGWRHVQAPIPATLSICALFSVELIQALCCAAAIINWSCNLIKMIEIIAAIYTGTDFVVRGADPEAR